MSEPQRYLLSIAYQAGPDPRIAMGADGSRDFFSPAQLEKSAWAYTKSSRSIGLFHENGTEGHADVVESYIYRGPDWDLGDGVIVKSGDWLLGMILDPVAWELYEKGDITGVSPQGTAKRRKPSPTES